MAATGASAGARFVPRADEWRAWEQTERKLAQARLVAAAIGVVNLLMVDLSGPAWTIGVAWGGCALIAGSATWLLWRASRGRLTSAVGDRAAWAETIGLATLLPAATDEHTAFVILMILLMSVLASLRDGRRGLFRALAVGTTFELVRSVLALSMVDHVHPEDSLIGISLAAAVGAVVGHVAELARERATTAQRAAGHLELQRRVVLAGIGSREEDALQRMAGELATGLDGASVSIVLCTGTSHPTVIATTDADIALRSEPVVLPDGPLDRTLNHGELCRATPSMLAGLRAWLPERGSVTTAPIHRGDTVIGALCIDTPPGHVLAEEDLQVVEQLSDQMALVIEAARTLEREADLAARYRDLDRLKTDFVAITSHELRTPLTTVVGAIETMRQRLDELTPAELQRLVGALGRQASRLSRLVDDLGTVSRVDAGTLVTLPRPTSVDAVARDVLLGLPEADIALHGDGTTAPAMADPDRLTQVITNLVANGLQHGEGTVHLEVGQNAEHVLVRVWDDGPGIPPERREDVFERFVRLGDTNSHSRGSGLGLAIARELTHAMDGDIAVVDLGPRSCFEVRLPMAATLAPEPETPVRACS